MVHPKYSGKSIANIPSTVLSLFNLKNDKYLPKLCIGSWERYRGKIRNVIYLLIDALSYNKWIEYAPFPAFNITSVFPSTTINAVTTLSLGLLPAEHGLFEWTLYIPEFQRIIEPILYQDAQTKSKLNDLDLYDPAILFRHNTIYEYLANNHVKSNVFMNKQFSTELFNLNLYKGANINSFITFSDALSNLVRYLKVNDGNNYYFLYWEKLDTLGHIHGPSNIEYRIEIETLMSLLQKELIGSLSNKIANETLIIISADHGQIDVKPNETVYLSDDPYLYSMLQTVNGNTILPTGSARDIFFHIKPNLINQTYHYLQTKYNHIGVPYVLNDAENQILFGKPISSSVKSRFGDILFLPYDKKTVWRKINPQDIFSKLGHHGGLHPDEMQVPLMISLLSEMKYNCN